MRLLRVTSETRSVPIPEGTLVCHDIRNPATRSEVLVRKGTPISSDQLRDALERGVAEIHIAIPDEHDLAEDAAAARLAAAAAGEGVRSEAAHFGQVALTSTQRGMLRINASVLDAINSNDGVLVITAEADRPVESGTTLGIVKCAPLFLAEATLRAVESIATTAGPVLQLHPFVPTRVALIAPEERLRGGAFERARAALAEAIEWYGSSLDTVIATDATPGAMATAYQEALRHECQLLLTAGAAATDPMDVVFDGLLQAGGTVQQIGIPLEPGTACWIGSLSDSPVLGLASCELFGRPGALDVLLPRLFTGEPLNRTLLRKLAPGGLLLGPSRVAPYHTLETVGA